MRLNVTQSGRYPYCIFGMSQVQISASRTATLTEVCHVFPQFLYIEARIEPQISLGEYFQPNLHHYLVRCRTGRTCFFSFVFSAVSVSVRSTSTLTSEHRRTLIYVTSHTKITTTTMTDSRTTHQDFQTTSRQKRKRNFTTTHSAATTSFLSPLFQRANPNLKTMELHHHLTYKQPGYHP